MSRHVARWASAAIGLIVGLGALGTSAVAADNTSFTFLRSQGFEIKSVIYLPPGSVGDRRGQTINASTVLISLQRERAVATCIVPTDVWAYQDRLLDNDYACQLNGDRF